jgi:hypothetical protein
MTTDLISAEYVMDVVAARRLTERIRLTAFSVIEGMAKVQGLVDEAKSGNAHIALGYPSWTAYLADTLGSEPLRLPRDQRQELVGYLAGEGMSTRAIAPIVGASQRTVADDVSNFAHLPQPSTIATPERVVIAEQRRVELPPFAPATGEVLGSEPKPTKVTGLDGKTYTRPASASPRATPRRALTDVFFDAVYDLTKITERIERLTADDRFPQNVEKVAAKHRDDLNRAKDALQGVIDQLL